jgi:hypothetical protein
MVTARLTIPQRSSPNRYALLHRPPSM